MAAGAYSSIFLATPVVVDLKEREPRYAALRARVLAKRSSAGRRGAPVAAGAAAARSGATTATAVLEDPVHATPDDGVPANRGARPAARPQQRKRAGGKPGRPSGSKRRR
jgi:preprotein translocase subunit SecF